MLPPSPPYHRHVETQKERGVADGWMDGWKVKSRTRKGNLLQDLLKPGIQGTGAGDKGRRKEEGSEATVVCFTAFALPTHLLVRYTAGFASII